MSVSAPQSIYEMLSESEANVWKIVLTVAFVVTTAWSIPFYPVPNRAPLRVTRFAPPPRHFRPPIHPEVQENERQRPKRDHHDYDDHERRDTRGVTGPVHTFVKTDKNANYKWGVRHHVGNQYAP